MLMKFNLNTVLNILLVGMAVLLIGRYFYSKPAFINGERAPDFSAQIINGEEFQLSDLRGRYVLLDFWGSWCSPCRAKNPELVELYRKYEHARFEEAGGFDIVSVGIERNESSWQRAIERDGLNWPYHILDKTTSSKFFNGEIANLYGIKEVPTTFLINEKSVIIGVNLDVSKIDKMLKEKKRNSG
jgi:thiol-disulfide isomerase/thioredoxin